jgi:hypothetical protein
MALPAWTFVVPTSIGAPTQVTEPTNCSASWAPVLAMRTFSPTNSRRTIPFAGGTPAFRRNSSASRNRSPECRGSSNCRSHAAHRGATTDTPRSIS